jgi:hypothetical protein
MSTSPHQDQDDRGADVPAPPVVILSGFEDLSIPPVQEPILRVRREMLAVGLHRLRRFVEPSLLLTLVIGMLVASTLTDNGDSPDTHHATPPSSDATVTTRLTPASSAYPRLVAPGTARPSERVPALAFRYRRLCGDAELRFDGARVMHRVTGYVRSPDSELTELFMTLDVPAAAKPGAHRIELFGPIPGGAGGPICADEPQHHRQLATTTITIGRGSAGRRRPLRARSDGR